MKDHRLIDERSRAFDLLIAEKLRHNPSLTDKARANLSRWLQSCDARSTPDLLEWQRLLAGPFAEILGRHRVLRRALHALAPIQSFLRHPHAGRAPRDLKEFYARELVAA